MKATSQNGNHLIEIMSSGEAGFKADAVHIHAFADAGPQTFRPFA